MQCPPFRETFRETFREMFRMSFRLQLRQLLPQLQRLRRQRPSHPQMILQHCLQLSE